MNNQPIEPKWKNRAEKFAPECFEDNNMIWKRTTRNGERQTVLVVPQTAVQKN